MTDRPETYTPQEAARILGVSDERVRQLIDSGELLGEKRAGRYALDQRSVHTAPKERGSPWRIRTGQA
jgi:excisionase family DNA binding protein